MASQKSVANDLFNEIKEGLGYEEHDMFYYSGKGLHGDPFIFHILENVHWPSDPLPSDPYHEVIINVSFSDDDSVVINDIKMTLKQRNPLKYIESDIRFDMTRGDLVDQMVERIHTFMG